MQHPIEQASDLGGVIRAARKAQKWRQNDAAERAGVSESFMVKAERGADTVQWGKVFGLLQRLGVRVLVELPDAGGELLERETAQARRRADARAARTARAAKVDARPASRVAAADGTPRAGQEPTHD
ncbi:helix-turn-helix domain-containing protein [Burkholderia anthina]|uniref:Helix-turn-helix domain-containing protein n=1 Tax=Burkholderia anthina TaxID=179879 RepID=A0A6P2GBJ1_9BURK|nr:helix-turn-helix domain-containing protein [Burkholderia anthina]MBM2769750.1 helix-turn-helix domain-containing protein [Burkholderia anthina]VVU50985.1 helix-turn-helix domain-containing protein [Burkholderia anthina]